MRYTPSQVTIDCDDPVQLRAVLHHVLGSGDVIGRDTEGRTVLALAVDDWLFDELSAITVADDDREDDDPLEETDPAEEEPPEDDDVV